VVDVVTPKSECKIYMALVVDGSWVLRAKRCSRMMLRMLLRMLMRMLSHIACLHVAHVALRVAPADARFCWILRVAPAFGQSKRNARRTRRMPGTCLGWYMSGYRH
jgi:hypothetical protein